MALSKRNHPTRGSQRGAGFAAALLLLARLWSPSPAVAASAGDTVRVDVSYASPDGFRILASYYRPRGLSDRAVIVFPDPKEGRKAWDSVADTLSAHGFHVLVPDLRGAGESTDQRGIGRDRLHFSDAELAAASDDAVPAIRFVREIHGAAIRSIVLVGSGEGGLAALQRSPRGADRFARILVSPDPAAVTGGDSASDADPVLVVVGKADVLGTQAAAELVPTFHSRECWLVDASDKGAGLLRSRTDLLPVIVAWILRSTAEAGGEGG